MDSAFCGWTFGEVTKAVGGTRSTPMYLGGERGRGRDLGLGPIGEVEP